MSMNFRIGCAVWSYKGWVGDLYPPGSRPTDFLHLYSQRFTAVEGNTTFYAIPDFNTVERWVAQTSPGFKFCLKLPREITHQGLLEPYIPDALSFVEKIQGLGNRLGVIQAQLPPSYSPACLDDLINFLNALPRGEVQFAVEVRHIDWFQEPYAARLTTLLQQLGIGRVLLDSRPIYSGVDDPQLQSERKKPKLPLQTSVTAPFSLIRFISHPTLEFNQTFLEEWVTFVEQWLRQGTQLYFFVHCPVEERSPHNARYFQQMLSQQGVSVPPLPWNNIQQFPNQLSLF